MAVDSGASETVLPPHHLEHVRTVEGEASRRQVCYEVANGDRIANLGEKTFTGLTDAEGHIRTVKAQVCDVSKPLMSVSRLVKAGNTVVFAPEGAHILHADSGERIRLTEKNGMYHLRMWVQTSGGDEEAGF